MTRTMNMVDHNLISKDKTARVTNTVLKDNNRSTVRRRTLLICLGSALGLYLSIYLHSISLLVFILNIASIFFLKPTELYCELFFLFPFTMIFKFSPASTSLFTYLSLLFTLYFLWHENWRIQKHFLLLLIVFASYILVGMGANITGYIKLVGSMLLAYTFVKTTRREDFSFIVLYMSLGVVISSIIGLRKASWTALATFFSDLNAEYINGVQTYRFSGLYMDPNYFSILIIVCLVTLFIFALKKEMKRTLAFILSIVLLIFGCLTYSKIFYVTLTLAVIFLVFIRIKATGKIISSMILILIVIAIGYILADKYGIVTNIIYRFSAEDISNNRINIWNSYFSYFQNSFKTIVFGDGIGAGYYEGVGVHNFYIEMIYFLGIFGTLFYVFLCMYILKAGRKIRKRTFLNYALLIMLLVMFATLGMLLANDLVFLLMMTWIFLNIEINEKKSKDIILPE